MDKLFVRQYTNLPNYFSFAKTFQPILNLKNLTNWTLKKTISYYEPQHSKEYLVYRFNLIHEWFLLQPKNSPLFPKQLRHYINVLNLETYLNAYEKNFIYESLSKQFTLDRNLKSLVIDFNVEKDETAYFHYRKFILVKDDNSITEDIDFYLTNTRIVITFANQLISFYLNKITNLVFQDNHFYFNYYGHKYIFKCDRPQIILMSFRRISALTSQDLINE